MSLADSFKSLQEVDLQNLSLNNIGSWPIVIRVFAWIIAFVVILFLGYNFHLSEMMTNLSSLEAKEQELKESYTARAMQAANIEKYRVQMNSIQEDFGSLLRQLPSDTEVPGLLEDITKAGLGNQLVFDQIKLLPEATETYYVELPMDISVTGEYHGMGAFITAVANLSRIVTWHDLSLAPVSSDGNILKLQIRAKTYRYKDGGGK